MDFRLNADQAAFQSEVSSFIDHDLPAGWNEEQEALEDRLVIERAIRGAIGFAGPLLTDDLSMNALAGTIGERAAAAIAAGCDVALHCNGRMDEMVAVAGAVPVLGERALERIAQAAQRRLTNRDAALDSARQLRSIHAMEARFAELTAAGANAQTA